MDNSALIREKLNEYLTLLAPLNRVEKDITLSREMLRLRTEEEINTIAPVLAVLGDTLEISTVDLLLAPDRVEFVRDAINRAGLTVIEIRDRLLASGPAARDDLRLLGVGEEW